MTRRVFVDSSHWLAIRIREDQWHRKAATVTAQLISARAQFVTTPLVFAETHARVSRSPILRSQVIRDIWQNPAVHIEHPSPVDYENALKILKGAGDKSYSFCDAVSFAVMQRTEIKDVLSWDEHFRQFGMFHVLID